MGYSPSVTTIFYIIHICGAHELPPQLDERCPCQLDTNHVLCTICTALYFLFRIYVTFDLFCDMIPVRPVCFGALISLDLPLAPTFLEGYQEGSMILQLGNVLQERNGWMDF